MREDTVMQAILRFARGDSGATVVARTSALREDLPVDGRAQVVETWSDTTQQIARRYRALGDRFTVADVADAVDVTPRQVRRVLDELAEAGYIERHDTGPGVANEYDPVAQPDTGEVALPDRDTAAVTGVEPGRDAANKYYTWNVRVSPGDTRLSTARTTTTADMRGIPPAPRGVRGGPPPG